MKIKHIFLLILASTLLPVKGFAGQSLTVVLSVSSPESYNGKLPVLKYPKQDGERFIDVMTSVGDVGKEQAIQVDAPNTEEFKAAFGKVNELLSNCKGCLKKFIFYYSGHSEQKGLHLRDGLLKKTELHALLGGVESRTKIAILDSCFAAALSKKGMTRMNSEIFLPVARFDEPTGYVFLAATSDRDFAFESDELKGSVFTHHLNNGLIGRADADEDGIVSISELYSYVYKEMKSNPILEFENIKQKPEFVSRLAGKGALAVTFPKKSSGVIQFKEDIGGLLTLIRKGGIQHFKFEKKLGEEKTVSLPVGEYQLIVNAGPMVGSLEIDITKNLQANLNSSNLDWVSRKEWDGSQRKGSKEELKYDSISLLVSGTSVGGSTSGDDIFITSELIASKHEIYGYDFLSFLEVFYYKNVENLYEEKDIGVRWGIQKNLTYNLFFKKQNLIVSAGYGLHMLSIESRKYYNILEKDSGLGDSFFIRASPRWNLGFVSLGLFLNINANYGFSDKGDFNSSHLGLVVGY